MPSKTNSRLHGASLLTIGLLATGLVAPSVTADDLSYTFLEVAGTYSDPNLPSAVRFNGDAITRTDSSDGYGGSIRASLALPEILPFIGFHVAGEYNLVNLDYSSVTTNGILDGSFDSFSSDQTEWRLAAGVHANFADRISAFAEVGYVESNFGDQAPLIETSSGGFDARVGLRGMLTDKFEVNGFVRLNPNSALEVMDGNTLVSVVQDEGVTFNAGARYHLVGALSLVADYEFGEDVSRLRAGLRLSF